MQYHEKVKLPVILIRSMLEISACHVHCPIVLNCKYLDNKYSNCPMSILVVWLIVLFFAVCCFFISPEKNIWINYWI